MAASRGSLGPGTAVRWVPPELAKELVEREDFVLHHTYEVVPTETRTPPYQTRSMSLLPMFGQAVRRTASVLPSCSCRAETLGNISSQGFNVPLLCKACSSECEAIKLPGDLLISLQRLPAYDMYMS